MTKQEEKLWNYIDGFCSDQEKAEIEAEMLKRAEMQLLYQQLLEVSKQLSTHLEIDEPSMSFTRNVMAQVQHEIAPVALKTKVDQRIIYAIGGFFAMVLLGIMIYAFATASPDFTFKAPTLRLNIAISPTVLWAALFINAVLLLVYLDGYLRKGMKRTQKKGAH